MASRSISFLTPALKSNNAFERTEKESNLEGNFCKSFVRQWRNKTRVNQATRNHCKSSKIIEELINQTDNKILQDIGDESEGTWKTLTGQCQMDLMDRCEIPFVCERTVLDPTPRSQYFLTHQLLQRVFIDIIDCPDLKEFISENDIYANLCAKMYIEAKFLDAINVPILQRGLFAEYGNIFLQLTNKLHR